MERPTTAWISCRELGLVWALYWVLVQMLSAYHDPKLQTSRTAPIHSATKTLIDAHRRYIESTIIKEPEHSVIRLAITCTDYKQAIIAIVRYISRALIFHDC